MDTSFVYGELNYLEDVAKNLADMDRDTLIDTLRTMFSGFCNFVGYHPETIEMRYHLKEPDGEILFSVIEDIPSLRRMPESPAFGWGDKTLYHRYIATIKNAFAELIKRDCLTMPTNTVTYAWPLEYERQNLMLQMPAAR